MEGNVYGPQSWVPRLQISEEHLDDIYKCGCEEMERKWTRAGRAAEKRQLEISGSGAHSCQKPIIWSQTI